jgi:hypothetical protein
MKTILALLLLSTAACAATPPRTSDLHNAALQAEVDKALDKQEVRDQHAAAGSRQGVQPSNCNTPDGI